MSGEKLVPEIRFSDFSGSWTRVKLVDVVKLLNGRAYKRSELLDKGKYPVLRVGNFYTNEKWFYSNLELTPDKYVNHGDLLYTWSATFGPHIWAGDKAIFHYHIWKIILSDKVKRDFLFQLLIFDKNNLLANLNGSTMLHLTKKGMEQKLITIPFSLEQEKIGRLFQYYDDLIMVEQHKGKHLLQLKRALLQKLFPADNAITPSIRFAGFADDWKINKLGEVAEIISGGDIDKQKIKTSGRYPVIANGLNGEGIIGYYNDFRIMAPSVTVTARGDIGHARARFVNFTPVVRLLSVSSRKFDNVFLENAINRIHFGFSATGVPQLTVPDLSVKKVVYPSLEEQKKIGLLLTKVDELILNNSKKKDALNELKRALMQKMFV
ncbi:restriction endonuclease subunit S [Leuconostocaceae bacterium ESL0723]|nr:restriction endonuclease subunit S [Leuconostocaceae bacterium ESL0723]